MYVEDEGVGGERKNGDDKVKEGCLRRKRRKQGTTSFGLERRVTDKENGRFSFLFLFFPPFHIFPAASSLLVDVRLGASFFRQP